MLSLIHDWARLLISFGGDVFILERCGQSLIELLIQVLCISLHCVISNYHGSITDRLYYYPALWLWAWPLALISETELKRWGQLIVKALRGFWCFSLTSHTSAIVLKRTCCGKPSNSGRMKVQGEGPDPETCRMKQNCPRWSAIQNRITYYCFYLLSLLHSISVAMVNWYTWFLVSSNISQIRYGGNFPAVSGPWDVFSLGRSFYQNSPVSWVGPTMLAQGLMPSDLPSFFSD